MRLLIAALAMVIVGCAPATQPTPGPPTDDARIGLTEWDITSSATALTAGMITLEITNAGATTHDLRVSNGDLQEVSPVLSPGETAELVFRAVGDDAITLWCSLPGHRQQGMERQLPVVAVGASTEDMM